MMDIVEALKQRQGKMSERRFAKVLGVSHVLWIQTKRRDVPPGAKLLGRAKIAYPELGPMIDLYMMGPYLTRRSA